MSVWIDEGKCTGCGRCVEVCPGDLLALRPTTNRAYLRAARDCWDCMACVKVCPQEALEVKLPFSLADRGAHLRPRRKGKHILWKLTYPDGTVEEFLLPTVALPTQKPTQD